MPVISPIAGHVHSYVRWKISRYKDKLIKGERVFKCSDPDCSHYRVRSLVIGKNSLCPKCKKNIFVLTWQALQRAEPMCLDCSNTKEAKQYRKVKEVAANLLYRRVEKEDHESQSNPHSNNSEGVR